VIVLVFIVILILSHLHHSWCLILMRFVELSNSFQRFATKSDFHLLFPENSVCMVYHFAFEDSDSLEASSC